MTKLASQPRTDTFVSVVAPLLNDAPIVADFVREVTEVLRANYTNYELVLVDDGSADGTVSEVNRLLETHECVRMLALSRSFGEEAAIAAGLDSAIGDFVVVMMPNTDPPEVVPMLVAKARSGHDVVFGVRRRSRPESVAARVLAQVFYWYARRVLKLPLRENASHFRAMSRRTVNAIIQVRDRARYLRLLSLNVGFIHEAVAYDEIERNPLRPRRSVVERIGVAMDMIIANSAHPLRFVTFLGIAGASLNVLYACYVVIVYIVMADVAEGWTTLSLQGAGMFFLCFLVLTVLSEYVGHILNEVSSRPLYYVREEHNSSVTIADRERRNVVVEASRL
jgi:glycosyltransferase involved in cell wall biosynthesis